MKVVSAPTVTIECNFSDSWSYVRDQGQRPTCLACALSDMNAAEHGEQLPFSVEALYFHATQYLPSKNAANGLTILAADQSLRNEGQPLESLWPYGSPPSCNLTTSLCDHWLASIHDTGVTSANLVSMLRKCQKPILMVLRLTADFFVAKPPAIIPMTTRGHALHAVVAVGLGADAVGGQLVLIRNSWGVQWGNFGYAWLEEGYLQHNLVAASSVMNMGRRKK